MKAITNTTGQAVKINNNLLGVLTGRTYPGVPDLWYVRITRGTLVEDRPTDRRTLYIA